MHEPGPERNAGQLGHVVQERKPEEIGEYAIGWDLITGHGARPGKALIRHDTQRLLGGS